MRVPAFCCPSTMKRLLLSLLLFTPLHAADDGDGSRQYILCGACHGQSGEGTAAGPPLAGSEWVNGPPENLIRIQLRGLQGPIKVKGVEYSFPAPMPPLAYQTDSQIAGVLTFIRSSFGNNAPAITPADVAALRHESGKPILTAADLNLPSAPAAVATAPGTGKYDHLDTEGGFPIWAIVALSAAGLAGAFVLLRRS